MKRQPKVEVGQCYRWLDHVYMVLFSCPSNSQYWVVQDTLSKLNNIVSEKFLKQQQRPFQNWG